jgi:BON domain-containing protein
MAIVGTQQFNPPMLMKNRTSTCSLHLTALLLAFFLTGCASDRGRTTGRQLDDYRVSNRVKSTLSHSPVYKFPNVRVTTYDGVVQLSGFVYKEEQKTEATELARRVPGVVEVINNISMVPATPGSASAREMRDMSASGGLPARDATSTGSQRETNFAPVTPAVPLTPAAPATPPQQ